MNADHVCWHPVGEKTMTSSVEFMLKSKYDAIAADKADLLRVLGVADRRVKALEAALVDYRDHGLRFDLNPTHDLRYASTEAGRAAATFWHAYIKDMDDTVRQRARNALAAPETPVSTLCAVCDQIKELHPASHPWTARTTAETGAEPVMTGVDMASGPGRTMYHCPDCGITDYPCNHYKDALRQQAQSDRSGKQP